MQCALGDPAQQGVGPGDLQRSLPTLAILWFCDEGCTVSDDVSCVVSLFIADCFVCRDVLLFKSHQMFPFFCTEEKPKLVTYK